MTVFISNKLPDSGKLACIKIIFCQHRQKFYGANYGASGWHWTQVPAEQLVYLVKQGWTAAAVPNIAEFLHNQNEGF